MLKPHQLITSLNNSYLGAAAASYWFMLVSLHNSWFMPGFYLSFTDSGIDLRLTLKTPHLLMLTLWLLTLSWFTSSFTLFWRFCWSVDYRSVGCHLMFELWRRLSTDSGICVCSVYWMIQKKCEGCLFTSAPLTMLEYRSWRQRQHQGRRWKVQMFSWTRMRKKKRDEIKSDEP